MESQGDVITVTAPVVFELSGDRLRFEITSGRCSRTFSITFFDAIRAAHEVMALMAERERAQAGRVRALKRIEAAKRRH